MNRFQGETVDQSLARAVQVLREGDVVAFPTETVYGLGADATNPAAVRYIMRMMAVYMHLRPFSQRVIESIDRRIRDLDEGRTPVPTIVNERMAATVN